MRLVRLQRSGAPPASSGTSFLDDGAFRILCEIEPPRRPDVQRVHEQLEALSSVADAFLIPDNHLGRATISSIAIAREVADAGHKPVACLNARDRNLLGFRRDVLTAAAYDIDHLLFVYGDRPREGRRADDLTVRGMIDECRSYEMSELFERAPSFRLGTAVTPRRPLAWRKSADFLVTQIVTEVRPLVRWRETLDYGGKVFAAVLVLASSRMAERANAGIPGIDISRTLIDKLADDPSLGVDIACAQIEEIKDSKAFDGVHLISVGRYREMAGRLAGGGP